VAQNMTDYLRDAIINEALRNTDLAAITPYLALFTTATDRDGGGTEVVTTGGTLYARQAITFSAPSNGVTANSADVTFPEAGANWGTISHAAIMDSDTEGAGNMLFQGALNASQVVNTGNIISFAAGDVDVDLTT
jgi:hypothetical protein